VARPDVAPLHGAIAELANQIRIMQATFEKRFDQLDRAIVQVEGKVDALDRKVDALDHKVGELSRKVDANTEGLLKLRIMATKVSDCIFVFNLLLCYV